MQLRQPLSLDHLNLLLQAVDQSGAPSEVQDQWPTRIVPLEVIKVCTISWEMVASKQISSLE